MTIIDQSKDKFFPPTRSDFAPPLVCDLCGTPLAEGSHKVVSPDGSRTCISPNGNATLLPYGTRHSRRAARSGVERERERLERDYPEVWR